VRMQESAGRSGTLVGMSPTTRGGTRAASRRRKQPPPLDRQERVKLLLELTRRRIVPIRNSFVQQGRGRSTTPGPLAKFLTGHDDRGLEAYLLVHAMASAEPWNCRLPSQAWVGALGLNDDAEIDSARTAVSKTMRRLEDRKLIIRQRSSRLSDLILLKEDGTGDPYERPNSNRIDDRYFQLPHAYWLEGHHRSLSLPAKVMLLIALSLQDGFPLPYKRARDWYGVSEDSAEEGLRELGDKDLVSFDRRWRKNARSETGWIEQRVYTLEGSFSREERKKAARFRAEATPDADDEILDEI
jgi:hypothetical protein